jgi:hypothetical protein
VPFARGFQKFVYSTVGREFFTYAVFFAVGSGLLALLYLFAFKLKVRKKSQYLWLFICAGLYLFFTLQLSAHPEEALHFLEYGLLSYFLFRALSHRIHDTTIYLTAALFVMLAGTIDEFIQWMMPGRFWDFRDIGLNAFAGLVFLTGVWKGFRPETISGKAKKISVKILIAMITVNMIIVGLCLSNTPKSVSRYTSSISALSWLSKEEPMAEFGYKYSVPGIGTLYSRFALDKLREADLTNGELYGKVLREKIKKVEEPDYEELIAAYNQNADPFFYELLIHIARRDNKLRGLQETGDPGVKTAFSNTAFKENMILERYFMSSLRHSGLVWPDSRVEELKRSASLQRGHYTSRAGTMIITSFSLSSALVFISSALILVWVLGGLWIVRLDY